MGLNMMDGLACKKTGLHFGSPVIFSEMNYPTGVCSTGLTTVLRTLNILFKRSNQKGAPWAAAAPVIIKPSTFTNQP